MSEGPRRRPQRGPARPPQEAAHTEREPQDWDEPADWDEAPEVDETASAKARDWDESPHVDETADGEAPPERAERRRAGATIVDILGTRAVIGGAIVGAIAVVLIAISLLLIAGENHYRNCVYAAQVKAGNTDAPLARLGRTNEVEGCSHSPF
jgi:hypothetical protein